MRLNRVLQLTAAVSLAIAAAAFTISCSGEDGTDGRDGTSKCTVSATGVVSCGGQELGTLATGGPGGPGSNGSNYDGAPGPVGTACSIANEPEDGAYPIYCGSSTAPVGYLEGCQVETFATSPFEKNVICGNSKLYLCGTGTKSGNVPAANTTYEVIDPSKSFCKADGSGSDDFLATNASISKCGSNDSLYNINKQYCGFKDSLSWLAKKPVPLDLCMLPTDVFSSPSTVDDKYTPNLAIEYSASSGSWVLAASSAAPVAPSSSGADGGPWQSEYCQVRRDGLTSVTAPALPAPTYKKEKKTPETCGSSKVKINEGAWKGEYCGYKDANALFTTRTVVNNACGDGAGPDSLAFGKKYCKMEKKNSPYSVATEEFCFVGIDPATTRTKINEAAKYTLLTPSDWKDEYCGYASAQDVADEKLSVLKGVCGDGKGPNGEDVGLKWENQYCQAPKVPAKGVAFATARVGGASSYCIKNASTAFATAGSANRINEGFWKDQYCGYASAEAAEEGDKTILTGVCEDNTAPNKNSWGNEYCGVTLKGTQATANSLRCGGTAINQGTWQDEYCGYASKADLEADPKVISVLKGTCDNNGKPNAQESDSWKNEYCQVQYEDRTTGKTTLVGTVTGAGIFNVYCFADTTGADYATAGSANRVNEGTWKNEYCGFASQSDFTSKTFSKQTGYCGDGNVPNPATANSWGNDYCQVKPDDKLSGTTTRVSGGQPNVYCAEGASSSFAGLTAAERLNEGVWKGQYCFADNAIGVCPGGNVPISTTTLSTDSPKCVFENN